MTPELRAAIRALGLNGRGFAELVGKTDETVSAWGKARSGRNVQTEPPWAWMLVRAWQYQPALLDDERRGVG